MSTLAVTVQNESSPSGSGQSAWNHPGLKRVRRIIMLLGIGFASTFVLWYAFVHTVDIDALVKKSPSQVWTYLFSAPKSDANRTALFKALKTTLGNVFVGYLIGLIASIVVSSLFILSPTIRRTFMPFALLLRSVPLIALTPIIGLVSGYSITSVRVVTALVTFFPSLVNISLGLESAPKQSIDLIEAYGGSNRTALLKVRLPYAVPPLFAAMRIAVPGAMVGALLGEWLLTKQGIGSYLAERPAKFDYTGVWAAVAVVTSVALILYAVVGIIETPILARFNPERLTED
ncbi:MAG: binding-protein-dependent transport system inner rane component [Ilumatobacteraceae bacterium]|nr:binding-protein-dependent transport system inner rane component [Ilumatobacteraceae bacterium]